MAVFFLPPGTALSSEGHFSCQSESGWDYPTKISFSSYIFYQYFIYNIFVLHFYCTILIFIFRRATSHAQVKVAGITQEKQLFILHSLSYIFHIKFPSYIFILQFLIFFSDSQSESGRNSIKYSKLKTVYLYFPSFFLCILSVSSDYLIIKKRQANFIFLI